MKLMLCPFCLAYTSFVTKGEKHKNAYSRQYLACPQCEAEVPRMYSADYQQNPPAVVSAVGFTQHGKSAYFAALFYALRCMNLEEVWPGFQNLCLNDESLQTVYRNLDRLRHGKRPDQTAQNFPVPTMLHIHRFPSQRDCTLLLYDAAGESFTRANQLIRYASFVKRAGTVLFFFSLPDAAQNAPLSLELERLLETYIAGVTDLGTNRKEQNLLLVYTKADVLAEFMGADWPRWEALLRSWRVGREASIEYRRELRKLSLELREFTKNRVGGRRFLDVAERFFRRVSFSIVSSFGAEPPPASELLHFQVQPRRVLDPLLDVLSHGIDSRGLGALGRAQLLWNRARDLATRIG